MSHDESNPHASSTPIPQPDPFEGVPPGCSPPRAMWPLWLALIGFAVWVAFLVVLMIHRFHTSVV